MSLSKKYQKSRDQKWSLRFGTYHPDDDKFYGVVTHIQKPFIVLREHYSFVFDGVVVLPKKVIKGCRDNEFDRCANEILRHSGTIKDARAPRWLSHCTTLKQILEKLQKKDIWPAIEIIYKRGSKTETELYIGNITRIEKDAFWIYDYDAAGKWQKECEIKYSEIFKIEFDDNYTRHFNAYMRPRLPEH
jgi:hypothetical protein